MGSTPVAQRRDKISWATFLFHECHVGVVNVTLKLDLAIPVVIDVMSFTGWFWILQDWVFDLLRRMMFNYVNSYFRNVGAALLTSECGGDARPYLPSVASVCKKHFQRIA